MQRELPFKNAERLAVAKKFRSYVDEKYPPKSRLRKEFMSKLRINLDVDSATVRNWMYGASSIPLLKGKMLEKIEGVEIFKV